MKRFYVYLSGIDILIEGLQQTRKKILVYRCSNPIEVKKIVEQPQTIELWIIGHGQRDGINFGNEVLKYSELQDAPKKNRIVQLHCNHGGGKSLADYLCVNPIKSFVTDNYRSWNENRIDIQNLITKFYG